MSIRRRGLRRRSGTSITELGPTLWIVFLIITFPLLAFGTMGLRYVYLYNAVQMAANAGAQAKSFQSDLNPPTDVSAVNTANSVLSKCQNSWKGITITSKTYNMVICPFGGTPSRRTTPLPATQPADPATTGYDFEVLVTATIDPLWAQAPAGVQCPGLTTPLTTQARTMVAFENTQGLTQ